MLTLLGSLLGFLTSAFPQLLGLVHDWQDRKHELAILDRQMQLQTLGHSQRFEEIAATADIAESQVLYRHDAQPSGVKWVDGLRSSVAADDHLPLLHCCSPRSRGRACTC